MGLSGLPRNNKQELCQFCRSQWVLTSWLQQSLHNKCLLFLGKSHTRKKNPNDIVWAVKYMILELKLNLELNAHFCPPSFECAFLLPIAEPAAIIRILIHSYGILIAHWRVHQRNKNPVVQFSKAVYILHWEIPFF